MIAETVTYNCGCVFAVLRNHVNYNDLMFETKHTKRRGDCGDYVAERKDAIFAQKIDPSGIIKISD